ncbi:MAG TPA: hypothetical protein VGD21_03885 [Lysobacter sp.]
MKALSHLVSTAIALALSGAAFNAVADDHKGISTMECRPLNAAQTGLFFDHRGIANLSGAVRTVICPILRDQDGAYTAAVPGRVFAYLRAGAIPGQLRCTLYRGSAYTGVIQANSSLSPVVAAGAAGGLMIVAASNPGGIQTQMNLVCSFTDRVTFAQIILQEFGPTQ